MSNCNKDLCKRHIPVVVNAIKRLANDRDINIKSFSFDLNFDDSIVSFTDNGSYFNPYNLSVYQQLIEANYSGVLASIRTIEGISIGELSIPKYDGSEDINLPDSLTGEGVTDQMKMDALKSITQYILDHIDSGLVKWDDVLYKNTNASPYYTPTTRPTFLSHYVNFCPLVRLHAKANDSDMKEIRNIIFNSDTILSMHIHRDRFVDNQGTTVDEYTRRLGLLSSSANTKYPDIYFNVACFQYLSTGPLALYNGSCYAGDWYMTIDPTATFLYPHHQTSLLGHTVKCTIYYI